MVVVFFGSYSLSNWYMNMTFHDRTLTKSHYDIWCKKQKKWIMKNRKVKIQDVLSDSASVLNRVSSKYYILD